MSSNIFEDSLQYEDSRKAKADEYYTKVLGLRIKGRPSWNHQGGRRLQMGDVDVLFEDARGNLIYVSEKFRRTKHDDILVELWPVVRLSEPLSETPTKNIRATQLFYWNGDEELIMIDMCALDLYCDTLRRACIEGISDTELKELMENAHVRKHLCALDPLGEREIDVEILSVLSTSRSGKCWNNLCAVLRIDDIEELII